MGKKTNRSVNVRGLQMGTIKAFQLKAHFTLGYFTLYLARLNYFLRRFELISH